MRFREFFDKYISTESNESFFKRLPERLNFAALEERDLKNLAEWITKNVPDKKQDGFVEFLRCKITDEKMRVELEKQHFDGMLEKLRVK